MATSRTSAEETSNKNATTGEKMVICWKQSYEHSLGLKIYVQMSCILVAKSMQIQTNLICSHTMENWQRGACIIGYTNNYLISTKLL